MRGTFHRAVAAWELLCICAFQNIESSYRCIAQKLLQLAVIAVGLGFVKIGVVETFLLLSNDRRREVGTEEHCVHKQAAHAPIAIGKRMNLFETTMHGSCECDRIPCLLGVLDHGE